MSTTDARRPVPAAPGGLRSRVARRPLTAFLVVVAVVGWPLISVPALTAHGVLPGGPLPEEPFALGTTLLVMLPAALWVTAVTDGPGAVRALLRRSVRWRFGAGWWAAVLLALPVLTLAVGLATGQRLRTGGLLATLGWGAFSVLSAVLLVHLWEETVWAGFFQGRLEQRHGFLPAAALTAVPFAAVHLPLSFTGDLAIDRLALAIGGLLVLGVLVRLLVGATVRGAAGSLLAAGLVHASFNAANNEGNLVDDLLGGGQPSLYAVVAAALFTAGALLALRNRR
ncbi:CPBP family intramembrane glutamic endopeptidase [Geodermatophilus sp. DSM 45219]|uniref:CPBP family intramembrane glutamic endopeptidase n=1 Tax=Geodermatophilus sp. DSM 45219 TaxID=1881103 RepID=UPI0008871C2E|nr:CPBP family intramembrane glutamic endopeptidase [Geodermatophilus sp. DSM 45219]SDN48475.1 CAAX protease self-immunity [Geodermatophilus sp. DSM 45219]